MRRPFSISLQNRLALSCALFIGAALGLLTLLVNVFTGLVFAALIRENITEKSADIVRVMAEQYRPLSQGFDPLTVEAMGMYFVHEGYIVSVEDAGGGPVWNARSCDMQQCRDVIDGITARMGKFRFKGSLREERFPVRYGGKTVGTVIIESYGPLFYSRAETRFLASINRVLVAAGLVITVLSIAACVLLGRAIARPVNKAAEAARRIATLYAGGMNHEPLCIRMEGGYKTRELDGLSRSINDLAGQLEEGERRQKQLSADIAHELRTPLSCLQGTVEAMIDGVYPADREHLASCHEEILRLANLVQDLNTLTRLEWETVSLNKTDFDLAKLLSVTADQFRAAAREKGIEIRLDLCESPVHADYDRLKQVFINVLSNAVKYTDTGSITVGIKRGAKNRDVTIADTGTGIPEEDLPHIFERFYRSDKSRNRGSGGAGIGLTIAAAIIAAHGGTISARSGGTGSVFLIQL